MRKLIFIILSCLLISQISLSAQTKMQRSPTPGFGFTSKLYKYDEDSLEYQMEMAFLIRDREERYKRVEELLKMGANPDRRTGQFKWVDTNPLWKICRSERYVKLFVSYGADVKKRPYVARAIRGKIALTEEQYNEWDKQGEQIIILEETALNILKILLENGADPNMKGRATDRVLFPATDWNYNRYYKKHGDLAINSAIEYNSIKIVKLLFEYGAILDEKSVELAKQTTIKTGSSEMEELIMEHWNKQISENKKSKKEKAK